MTHLRAALLLCLLAIFPLTSFAAEYPSRPLRLLVPFAQNAPADLVARAVAPRLGERLGQKVTVENKPGANGAIAFSLAAESEPDGHTLLLATTAGATVNPLFMPRLPHNPAKDLRPVSLVARAPIALVAHPGLSADSLDALLAFAKSAPEGLQFGSARWHPSQFAAALFRAKVAGKLVQISHPSQQDLLKQLARRTTAFAFLGLPDALHERRAGSVKVLAVTGVARSASLPVVPTLEEVGVAGLDVTEWLGVMVAASTPLPAIARLNEEITRVVDAAEVRAQLQDHGYTALASAAEELAALMRSDSEMWIRIVKETGMQP